ncbi:MAG: HAMP domain-containing sensor histidine kinase [Bacteroidetes bacterium]|jgi:two-component system phosphate regulon sensor histidine kinase PhoR|nr:HAMP domain-containing sensor histidine kinase [Bacteroidota bacterium]
MNKQLIAGIIVVMTIALIGLMGIQVYWIGDAIKVKEATFVRDVNQAITQVVVRLEKEEMQRQFQRQLQLMNRRADILSSYDSISYNLQRELKAPMTLAEYQAFLRKTVIAQDMIEDMIMGYRQASEEKQALNPLQIDSLIRTELSRHGIRTTYEFGVYSPSRNAMLVQKTGRYPQQLLSEGFAFEMYPTMASKFQSDQLLMYFPHEKQFLMSQLWDLLGISGLLIVIIILSFSATIFTIIRQKKLSEMKSDFVNNMTHEFKTPIATIGLACEALRDQDVAKSEALYSTYISMIDEENKRLGTMAEQILRSAVMDKGELQLHKETVEMHEIIDEACKSKKLQADQRQGQLSSEFNALETMVEGDKVHLKNVVLNLLDNAIKYTENTPEIVVRTRNIPHALEISVQDNGPGISKANQKRIFEKLYRIPTGNVHNVKGFGLGLSYVKSIVEQHGGTINLNSELKKGTTFYIRLPLNGQKKNT